MFTFKFKRPCCPRWKKKQLPEKIWVEFHYGILSTLCIAWQFAVSPSFVITLQQHYCMCKFNHCDMFIEVYAYSKLMSKMGDTIKLMKLHKHIYACTCIIDHLLWNVHYNILLYRYKCVSKTNIKCGWLKGPNTFMK